MKAKISLLLFCMISLSVLGVTAKENQPEKSVEKRTAKHSVRLYSPDAYASTAQFEYEFEWQNGKIKANP